MTSLPIHARSFALLAAAASWLLASAAQAQCLQWNIAGSWQLAQANGPAPRLELQQDGDQVRGRAVYLQTAERGADYDNAGSVDGTVVGDELHLTIYWEQASVGVYNGKIAPDGAVQGGTYDKRNPDAYALWSSDHKAVCTHHAVGVGADGRPAMALGRVKPTAPATQCPRWDLSGIARMTQNGTASWLRLKLVQRGFAFSGDIDYIPPKGVLRAHVLGHIDGGRVTGNEVAFNVPWDDGKTGVYYGAIDPNGRVTGYTYDRDNHGESASWSMLDRAVCDLGYQPPPLARIGRVVPRDPNAPMPSICDAARSARARNSPAAPGLEAQCRAVGETTSVPIVPVAPVVGRAELDRLAEVGHAIAAADPALGALRRSNADTAYRFGFDVATGLFGDPTQGAQGNTALGPGSLNLRASLDASGQSGFDDSQRFHFSRSYPH